MENMNAIQVEKLSYRYPDGREALREVCFSVGEGERVALVGPNGAGKSTLLLHLNGLLPDQPSSSPSVTVFGTPMTGANLPALRSQVGLLFQDPDDQLFCPTVREDVAFGPAQLGLEGVALEKRVTECLAEVGLAGFEERLPHHLSRGEKRRVCLAGVLACEAKILVLDEPTSDLDPRGRRELKELLHRLPVTQVIATHDLEFAVELCSRVIVLDQGKVVAEGATAEILSDDELMRAHGLERPHLLRHLHPH